MSSKAAITAHRPRADVQRLWEGPGYVPDSLRQANGTVTFKDAPGDRGTEVHVIVESGPPIIGKLTGSAPPLSKIKDDLRRFKQRVETGEIPRSDAVPEGDLFERKLKQRPAQPRKQTEREKAGGR
jgi:uncharacterized membrane protein